MFNPLTSRRSSMESSSTKRPKERTEGEMKNKDRVKYFQCPGTLWQMPGLIFNNFTWGCGPGFICSDCCLFLLVICLLFFLMLFHIAFTCIWHLYVYTFRNTSQYSFLVDLLYERKIVAIFKGHLRFDWEICLVITI